MLRRYPVETPVFEEDWQTLPFEIDLIPYQALRAFRFERYAALRALQLHQCALGELLVRSRQCVCTRGERLVCIHHPERARHGGRVVARLPHEICARIARYEAWAALEHVLPRPFGVC